MIELKALGGMHGHQFDRILLFHVRQRDAPSCFAEVLQIVEKLSRISDFCDRRFLPLICELQERFQRRTARYLELANQRDHDGVDFAPARLLPRPLNCGNDLCAASEPGQHGCDRRSRVARKRFHGCLQLIRIY